MTNDRIEIPVCVECAKNESSKLCDRCGIAYCSHNASRIDFRYCRNCMSDFSITESIETKIIEYHNEEGVITSRKRQLARNLKLQGTDWLFAQAAILDLNDDELASSIEYHRNIASVLLMERETRRTEQLNKLAKVKIRIAKREDLDDTLAVKRTKKGSATTKTATKPTKAPDITGAIATLFKAGLSDADIVKLLIKGKK